MTTRERSREVRDDLLVGFWRRHVYIGVLLCAVGSAGVIAYLVATPDGSHRAELLVMSTICLAMTFIIFWGLGLRLVATRWRSPFFVTWSLFMIVVMIVGAWLDGGVASPLTWLVVLPVLYGGLAYPTRDVIFLAAAAEVSFVALVLTEHGGWAAKALTGIAILIGGLLAAFGAWNRTAQDRRIYVLATHDGLTGCLNHRVFMELLALEASRAERHDEQFTLLIADVDRLKELNDLYGHGTGDEALRRVGVQLRAAVRQMDAVGRIGGDEFAVLLPKMGPSEASAFIERARAAIESEQEPTTVTVSVGAATWTGPGDSATATLRRADQAMYSAKRARTPAGAEPRARKVDDGGRHTRTKRPGTREPSEQR